MLLALLIACDGAEAPPPPDTADEPATADGAEQGTETPNAPAAPDGPSDPSGGDWTAGIVDVPARADATGLHTLTELRWASHPGYERVTFEFEEATVPAFHLEYIDRPVRKCGSGDPTPIEGDGWLEVRLRATAAHTDAGEPTITVREAYPELDLLREVEITCDFEGEVVVVLGVGSPNRFRAQVLEEPARLVVDIRR